MNISKTLALIALVFFGAVAFSQTLPPPAFAGQSYWYGPGPSSYIVTSTMQDNGGFVEQFGPIGAWTANGGGPGFAGNEDHGTFMRTYFHEDTTVIIDPYIYVDGYFSTVAHMRGFTGGTLNVGTSRFFIVHNVPIIIGTVGLNNVGDDLGNPPLWPTVYNFTVSDYANPSNYSDSFSVNGGSTFADRSYSNVVDEGIMQVDLQRDVTIPSNTSAGTHRGFAAIYVSAV